MKNMNDNSSSGMSFALAPGARCLDAGCGPGETMRLLAQRVGGNDEGVQATLRALPGMLDHVDGLMIENFGDVPFYPGRVPAHVVGHMTAIAADVRARFRSKDVLSLVVQALLGRPHTGQLEVAPVDPNPLQPTVGEIDHPFAGRAAHAAEDPVCHRERLSGTIPNQHRGEDPNRAADTFCF